MKNQTSGGNPGGLFFGSRQMKILLISFLLLIVLPALAADDMLTDCRQIEDVEARVSCYDDIVDARNPDVIETSTANSARETENPEAIPSAQSLFGTHDAEAKRIVETRLAIEQIDKIQAVVTDVQKSVSKKLTLSLDNGQVWRQLDSRPLSLKIGEAVIVRKASLGSFLMEKQSGSRRIRVKRVN